MNVKIGMILLTMFILIGCGNSNQNEQPASSEEIQLVIDSDSLSIELSAATDSVEMKTSDLQSTLESLNN
ncbi:MAG: hypothetical protein HUJ22_02715 [Gracilimonas sp.]|uniref:hypothetical protein n=1 Tax=Gracilimonas sp. TaxID=1974203 RepID=UPI001985915B|nr:hypothetical protein [Gracilimonas sp.]MBD3615457.1 hypothetical protein [Gracilimonas sp.]